MLNELEDLYGAATPGLDKKQVARLLSLMKEARRTGAALILTHEQGNYRKVLQDEKATKETLATVRATLKNTQR